MVRRWESVLAQLNQVAADVENGAGRTELAGLLAPGAARNAVDCALWDIEAKLSGIGVAERINIASPQPVQTAYTISLDTPEAMAAACRKAANRPVLKVKVGTGDDLERIEAVALAAPDSRIMLDANEGWCADTITEHLEAAARHGIAMIEQPLARRTGCTSAKPAASRADLRRREHPWR